MLYKSKYRAKKCCCYAGHVHDSKKEAARCDVLQANVANGNITNLIIGPWFPFIINGVELKHRNGHKVGYTADFAYQIKGKQVVEEVKGFVVRDWPLRRAIFKALYSDVEFIEV